MSDFQKLQRIFLILQIHFPMLRIQFIILQNVWYFIILLNQELVIHVLENEFLSSSLYKDPTDDSCMSKIYRIQRHVLFRNSCWSHNKSQFFIWLLYFWDNDCRLFMKLAFCMSYRSSFCLNWLILAGNNCMIFSKVQICIQK